MKNIRVILCVLLVSGAGSLTTARDTLTESSDESLIDALVIRNGVTFSEIEESGRTRWTVQGSRAESRSEDVIRIHDVTATIVQEDGEKILVITEMADINRRTREIETQVYVEIMSGNRIITGTGMHVDTEDKNVQLLKDVHIVFLREQGDDFTIMPL